MTTEFTQKQIHAAHKEMSRRVAANSFSGAYMSKETREHLIKEREEFKKLLPENNVAGKS